MTTKWSIYGKTQVIAFHRLDHSKKRIEKKQQINHVIGIENATDSGQLIDN